jgi:hypothetical protein
MRVWIIPVLLVVLSGSAAAQDGSDMRYLNIAEVDRSIVGRRVHLDFYRNSSFHTWQFGRGEKAVDKVSLDIDGRQVEFIEHREDDGFNNWFNEQYLESSDKKMRITEFKLLEVGKKTIKVLATISVEPFSKEFAFDKKDIVQVLVKSNQ